MFSRQHPILYGGNLIRYNYFVADFYCAAKKAIIELDGSIHLETKEYDNYRDSELNYPVYNILRIKNEDLENMDETLLYIITFLNQLPDNL
jgi:leucyl-tRNA synthetase